MLQDAVSTALRRVHGEIVNLEPKLTPSEFGSVIEVGDAVARVKGLLGVGVDELVQFEDGTLGLTFNLDTNDVGVILLGHGRSLAAGQGVARTGRVVDTLVGEGLLGRVLDCTGKPLDGNGRILATERWPVERAAASIIERAPVTTSLETGIKVIDTLIPIGRGQRELILGDRQTGKTALAVDAIINQRGKDVVCIYCAIGQRDSAVAEVISQLSEHGALAYSIVVVASGEDAPGLQFVTPYAATTMGEYFMEHGRDVLIVYDDLTKHARAYRELSLLLRRPPGREAYPGDIFYLHSRLLERATHLRASRGGGSLTALPILETEEQNLTAYIPTNLISITDGQVYLSPQLFQLGQLPAIDVGQSVSRVGGKAQPLAYRGISGPLRLSYAQFEELEVFARFGTRLDPATRAAIEHGRRIREILKQEQSAALDCFEQIVVLSAAVEGLFDPLDLDEVIPASHDLRARAKAELGALRVRILANQALTLEDTGLLRDFSRTAITSFK